MNILRSSTDPRWVEVALSDLDATLGDHAHCEKKAAASAVKLVADHADRPDLVRKVARLAQEGAGAVSASSSSSSLSSRPAVASG